MRARAHTPALTPHSGLWSSGNQASTRRDAAANIRGTGRLSDKRGSRHVSSMQASTLEQLDPENM